MMPGIPVIALLSSGQLETEYGTFSIAVYNDGREEALALWRGDIRGRSAVPCRIHSECLTSHVFYSTECECSKQMRQAMSHIEAAGTGLIIYLRQEGKGNGAAAHIATQNLKRQGLSQSEAYVAAGFPADSRHYGAAAKVIARLGVLSILPLSTGVEKVRALRALGVQVDDATDDQPA